MKFLPRDSQEIMIGHLEKHPYSGLFAGLGMGKTISTLTVAVDEFRHKEISKMLVIAPKKIAESVWHTEAKEWDHTRHLQISLVLGTEADRKRALKVKADIYVINVENVVWLITFYGGAWPFDKIVIDESSKFKSSKSARFKALRTIRPKVKKVVALSGTPRPNGLLDLWPQLYLLDMGERLGKTISGYRDKYFKPGRRNGHVIYDYNLKKEDADSLLGADINEKEIYSKISDICISLKSEEWLKLPDFVEQDIFIDWSPELLGKYQEFEKKQFLALEPDQDITAINAAALSSKLLQFCNGAVYSQQDNGERIFYEVHTDKLDRLAEDLEALDGEPLLLFYQFKHDLERIQKHLKRFDPRVLKDAQSIIDWNKGKMPFTLAHADSAGHGLNLQHGGHYLGWFGLPWKLESYLQACGRLLRPGQLYNVFNRRYVIRGTIEERVIAALGDKERGQNIMLEYIKAQRVKYLG